MNAPECSTTKYRGSLVNSPLYLRIALVVFLLLGLGIRLYDLTDPPLDFHPTRQLLGALISRGMYYQMLPEADPTTRALALEFSASIEEYEPPILNRIVAVTYLLMGSEQLWVARIYSSLFWLIGGVALFALASRTVTPRSALFVLGYYLFLPFAVEASRSFQVDPMMVMFILITAFTFYRWMEEASWKWAVIAGLLAGITILVKVTAGFPVIAMAVAAILKRYGFRESFRQLQVWAIAVLAAIPASLYYLISLSGRSSSYFEFWTLSMWHLVLDASFFVRWMSFIHRFLDLSIVFIGLAGLLIAPKLARPLVLGLWVGYVIYGTFFPFQIHTHDYYHLMLVAIIPLSAAPIVELFLARLSQQNRLWKTLFLGIAIVAVAYPIWVTRSNLLVRDFRHEPPIWEEIGQILPHDGNTIALTHDYGYRLMYYGWRKVSRLWPVGADLDVAEIRGSGSIDRDYFEDRTQDVRYFLVTLGGELERQAWLKNVLYGNYTILAEGDGYIIFDLESPLERSY
ncbi:MAG: glycosyltransferase family 39 protein [Anaerolineales bacterium]|nr:glycosyltransferase family 39 protein [Anaerolineales bacterium]